MSSNSFVLSTRDLDTVHQVTGLQEADIPDRFLDRFEQLLSAQQRVNPGKLDLSLVIMLADECGMLPEPNVSEEVSNVRWSTMPIDTAVYFRERKNGKWKEGWFTGVIEGGKATVRPKGITKGGKIYDLPQSQLKLRRSRKLPEREPEPIQEQESPVVKWRNYATGTEVVVDGKVGKLVGLTDQVYDQHTEDLFDVKLDDETVSVKPEQIKLYVK